MPPLRLHVQIIVVARTTDPNLGSPSEQRGIPQPLLLPLRRRRQRQSTISTYSYDSRLIFPTADLLSRTAVDLFYKYIRHVEGIFAGAEITGLPYRAA